MKKYCPYCKKESINRHVDFCKKRYGGLSREKRRYDFLIYNFSLYKDKLYDEYVNKRMSLPELKSKYDIDYKAIRFLLNYYNIKIRSIKDSSDIMIKNSKKTFQKKYGVDNVWERNAIGYKNRIKNLNDKYGVNNVFQIPDIIDKIKESNNNGGHEKRMKKMKERYGYTSPFQVPEIHKKALENSGKRITKLNQKIYEMLDNIGIDYEKEFYLNTNEKKYFYDIKIKNLLIEINGDYWHANPNVYDKNWFNKQKNMTADEIWKYDNKKINIAKNNGFDVLILWEKDIKKNSEKVYENIKNTVN